MPVYLYLLLGSFIVPALYSLFFQDFIKHWRSFLISTTLVAIFFLIWDAWFTATGVWGFNHDYCAGIFILGMPIEEWLFFFIIPFCSLFLHHAILFVNPNLALPAKVSNAITTLLIILCSIIVAFNFTRDYTRVNLMVFVVVLLIAYRYAFEQLRQFYITFLAILVPFFIVNGVLTGAGVESPIVWYNNEENLGIRLYTIPVEDIAYAFSMLFGNLLIFNRLNQSWKKKLY